MNDRRRGRYKAIPSLVFLCLQSRRSQRKKTSRVDRTGNLPSIIRRRMDGTEGMHKTQVPESPGTTGKSWEAMSEDASCAIVRHNRLPQCRVPLHGLKHVNALHERRFHDTCGPVKAADVRLEKTHVSMCQRQLLNFRNHTHGDTVSFGPVPIFIPMSTVSECCSREEEECILPSRQTKNSYRRNQRKKESNHMAPSARIFFSIRVSAADPRILERGLWYRETVGLHVILMSTGIWVYRRFATVPGSLGFTR